MPNPSRWWPLLALAVPILAQDPHETDRQALRNILAEVTKAINAQDIQGIVAQMSPDCTVTWWNAEVSRGHDDIRAYYRKMVKDPGRLIDKYTTEAKVGAAARFVGSGGDVAVADGSMEDEFFPVIRGPFKLSSRWSATVAKTGGQWKIVNLHMSSNVFTNPLMAEVTGLLWYAGAGGLVIGGLVGWFLGRRRRGTPANPKG